MGRCNAGTRAPPDSLACLHEKKTSQIYISYAAAVAGIRLHISRAPSEKFAAILTSERKPSHGAKSFDYRPHEKYGFCIPLGSPFSPPRNPVKSRYDSMNGVKRPPPPKHHYMDAQPTIPPPPYSDSVPPRSTANMNVKFQGAKSDVGEGQQLTNAGSSCGTRQIDQVDEPLEPLAPGTKLEGGSTTDGNTAVECQVHSTQSSIGEFVTIKIEDGTKEADFKISGVGSVTGAPIPVPHHLATDSKGDANDLKNCTESSSDPTSDHEESIEQPIPARRPGPTALSELLVRRLLAGPMDRLSKVVQMMIKYSRILQNLRNHDYQRLGVPPDIPAAGSTTTSPHPWGIRKWLALGSILLYYSLGQGTGAFDSWGFAHTSGSSQTPGNPNTPLGDTGGDIWSGRGPGFEDVTLLGQQLPLNFEELSEWFDQVPDVLARPPCGSTNHSPVGQPESHPVPPPPLGSEVPCAKSYNEGFNDAVTMILAAFQVRAPPAQSNPMAMNETQASHHPPPPFALPQEGQTGVGFPPDCPRPNARSTIPPLVNNLPQDSFPTTQSPHQALFDPDANLAWNVELSRLAPNSQPQCSETDRGQSTHPTQLAPPTSADLTPAPVPPFSPERQPSGVVRSTAERVTRQHICAHCSKSYRKPYQLRDHIKCKHEGGVKSYCCGHDGCGKTFTTRSNLVRHVKKEHQAGNVSQRNEGHASEASNEPARAAGRSTRRRRASDLFVVCTPDVMHYK